MSTTPHSAKLGDRAQASSDVQMQKQNHHNRPIPHKRKGRRTVAENKQPMGKPRIELPIPDSELLAEYKAGKSSRDLAEKYGASPGTIRNRLREHNRRAYNHVARNRISPKSDGERIILPVQDSELYKQWKDGMSTRDLAKKYKVSRHTIMTRLRGYGGQEYYELAQRKIAESIAEIAKEKGISLSKSELYEHFRNGESTITLAGLCNVSRQTISRRLAKQDQEQYETIARQNILTGRTKDLPVPTSEVFDKWENGEAPENLERLCGISYRQLLEKLKAYDPARYKRVAERRGLGSIRAKQYGARSLFELNVRRILEKYGIQAKEATLKLGKHIWRPDVLLADCKTIIEAMGLNFDRYWRRNKKKTKDYLRHEYRVIVVVPNEQTYRKATRYLSKKVIMLRYGQFENFVMTSLIKVLPTTHPAIMKVARPYK